MPNFTKVVFAIALLLSIAPFLVVAFFCHPAADDYCHAAKTLELGFVGVQRYWYSSWNGKYFSMMLFSLHPLVYGSIGAYKAVAIIVILLTFASIFSFLNTVLKSSFPLIDKLIAATFITALFSNHMPEVTEGYYWMPGSITYQLAGILTLFFFSSTIKTFEARKGRKALWFTLSCILLVAIAGCAETSMVVVFLLLVSIAVKAFRNKVRTRWFWLSFLVLTTLCALVVIIAPGNSVRSSFFPNRHRLLFSLGFSLAQEVRFLFKWFSNPALVLGTILFVPIAVKLSDRIDLLRKRLYTHPLIYLLLLLGVVFMGFFPAYWSTGLLGQHRTVNLVYFYFLVGWFINLAIWVSCFKQKWRLGATLPRYVYFVAFLLIPLSLLSTNNTKKAFGDLLSARAYRYDVEMKSRDFQIEQCLKKNSADCSVQMPRNLPATITSPYFETDLECEGQYWRVRTRASSFK
jgi:hypothetical protein